MKAKQEIAHSKFENNQMSTHEKDHSSRGEKYYVGECIGLPVVTQKH